LPGAVGGCLQTHPAIVDGNLPKSKIGSPRCDEVGFELDVASAAY
jgi:hypothetical protein